MKEKIMYLILGILIGAVITAGCFLVFSKSRQPQINGGQRPDFSDMSDEEREEMMNNRGEVFDRPNENTNSMNIEEPKADESSTTTDNVVTSNNV